MLHDAPCMWSLERNGTSELTYGAETDSQPQTTSYGFQGKDAGRDSQGCGDGQGLTAVFEMDNQQGPAGRDMELCSVFCGSPDERGVWGRVDTWMDG